MSLLSLIAVFLIEQLRPLSYRRVVADPLGRLADWVELRCNAGQYRDGVFAWLIVIVPAVLGTGILYAVSWSINPLAAR